MMEILAHRGYWKNIQEKNSIKSLSEALSMGYGIETDLRDYKGQLVISHNIADDQCVGVEELFKRYCDLNCQATLALNVKADGMQGLLKNLLDKYKIAHYFMFDMSVPEQVVYHDMNMKYYTRHSDVEDRCVMYDDAQGVWMDSFYDDEWLTDEIFRMHLEQGKKVCVVSPELHGKECLGIWQMIKENQFERSELVQLCTDKPEEARRFFYE